MTDTQREQIFNLRMLGLGYKTIADKVGLSKDIIKGFCKRNSINGPGEIVKLNFQIMQEQESACPCCGKRVNPKGIGRPKRFCSDGCRRKWWKENPDKKNMKDTAMYEFTCPKCNKEFVSYGNSKRKFCSHNCYIKSRFWEDEDGTQSN